MQTVTLLSTVFALLLLPLRVSPYAESETLRYTVRADSFEVELTRADGTKVTARPPRESTYFYFLAENGWPVPEGPGVTQVRCEIRWTGFPRDWRLVNSFGVDRRTQKFETTLGELRKAVSAGGDFRVAPSKRGVQLVARTAWNFPDVEAVHLLDRIAEVQTAIWRDRGLGGHVVYLLATNEAAGHWKGEARSRSTV